MAAANVILALLEGVQVVQRRSDQTQPRFLEIGIGTGLRIKETGSDFDFLGSAFVNVTTINGRDPDGDGDSLDLHLANDILEKHRAVQIFIDDSGALFAGANVETALAEAMTQANTAQANADTRLARDGSEPMEGALSMGGYVISNLGAPTLGHHAATRDFVVNLVAAAGDASEWQDSVIDTGLTDPSPLAPATGDRYLIGLDTGAAVAVGDWAGHDGDIAEWDGAQWVFTDFPGTPNRVGTYVSADDESDGFYFFGGATWTKKNFENVTASGFLTRTLNDITLAFVPAGQFIQGNGSGDAVAITISGDVFIAIGGTATIQAGAVDNGKLANNAVTEQKIATATFLTGGGIKGGGGTQVQRDDDLVLINSEGETVPAGKIVYIHTDGSFKLAHAQIADIEKKELGVTAESIADGDPGRVTFRRGAIVPGFSSLTTGEDAYLSRSSPGGVTQSLAGFLTNEPVIIVGRIVPTDSLALAPAYRRRFVPLSEESFVADGVASQFALAQPITATTKVMVWVDGRKQPETVAWNRNLSPARVDFTSVPNNTSRIEVLVVNV